MTTPAETVIAVEKLLDAATITSGNFTVDLFFGRHSVKQCSGSVTFWYGISDLQIRIGILLFSSVTLKTQKKKKNSSFLFAFYF
jgi:hypothetical protein